MFLIAIFSAMQGQNLSFHPVLYSIKDDSSLNETFIYPLIGWNENDHWMPGVYLTNQLSDKKKFRYQLLPLYSTATKSLSGAGTISLNSYNPHPRINSFSVFIQGKSFHLPAFEDNLLRFYQMETGAKATLKAGSDSLYAEHIFELKYHQNSTEEINWVNHGSGYSPTQHHKTLKAVRVGWTYEKYNLEQPFTAHAQLDIWNDFARMHGFYEYDYKINKRRWFTFRAFAGGYFFHNSEFTSNNDARLSTNAPGYRTDVFYDGWFLGRGASEAGYQMQGIAGKGAMYSITPVGKTWDWTVSTSLSISLPFDLPLRLYASAGIAPDVSNSHKPFGIFEAGILIMPPQKFFEIAFPLLLDKSSKDALDLNTLNYLQQIRFIVNFDRINPHSWLDNPYRRK